MSDKNTPLDQIPDSIRSEAAVTFRDLASTLYTLASAANVGKKSLKPLQLYAKTGDSLVKKIKDLDQKVQAVEKAANYLDNKPLVGPIAKALKPVAGALAAWSTRTKAELINLSETQRKIGAFIEPIAKTLDDIDKYGLIAGVAADTFSRKLAVAGQQLADAKQLFDTDIPFFGNDSNVKQKILLRISQAGADASEVAAEVSQLTAMLDGIVDAGKEIASFVENPVFQIIEEFADAITAVGNALSPVFTPIQKIYNALEPVLDALDSIFGWFLKPLEWALDAVIEATGINRIIEAVANELLKLLPDTSFLNGIIAELERVFLSDMKEFYEQKIEAPFNAVKAKLDDVNFPNQFSIATEGDDTLMGSLNSKGALTLDGLGGDDILIGSEFGDTLRGGAGMDILIGGGGNDLLDGGDNLPDQPDFAIYTGSINDYGIVSILKDGFATGTWFVTDLRSDTSIDGISDRINLGTDELRNIEVLVFDDTILDLRKIDTYILTRSGPGERAEVTPTFSTVVYGGQTVFTADGGIDVIYGALGFDILDTAGGNDQLHSGSNDPLTLTSQGAAGDILRGGLGNDIYVLGPRSGDKDIIEDIGGNDTVDYSLSEYGLNVFLGATSRELLYRPTTIRIDADPVGRAPVGLSYRTGLIIGIENILGTRFNDIFIGTDAINKISGGAGNDLIRGLDGDDILLGGDGNDILIGDGGNDYLEGGAGFNTYVAGLGDDYIVDLSSSSSQVLYSISSTDLDLISSTGLALSALTTNEGLTSITDYLPGAIVIVPSDVPHKQQVSKYKTSIEIGDRFGVDYLEGVEMIGGSTGDDIIYTAAGINQTIFGREGNDQLITLGSTRNYIYGGAGDDLFISSPDAKDTFFGGDGNDTVRIWGDNNVGFGVDVDLFFGHDNRQQTTSDIDTLDFSQSNYSWHMYFIPTGSGVLTGKSPLTSLYDVDPRFTQPTLGVNGEAYPGVNFELRVADSNTSSPGGRTTGIGEFNRIIGSQHRDFITGGSPRSAITIDGQGGDDVLFASQLFASLVEGGDGNDVLGTFNHTLGHERPQRFFDPMLIAVLNGGNGDDTFVGGDFREQIDGGEGTDLLTYEVSTSGVTVDLTTKTLDRGYATGDILIGGIINVIGSQFDDILTGDELNNELVGWDGDDIIRGMGGNDQLFGNDGDDQLFGGDGNDILHGGNGADLLDGGEGNDTASWSLYQVHPKSGINRLTNDTTGVIADLKTGKAGLDTLVSIENLIGSVGDDQLFGDDNDNFLGGGAGNDLLDGRGGDDVLIGGRGDDILHGGDGDDFLSGGAGNNELHGGAGIDSIDYSSLTYGVSIVMAGAGARAGFASGEVNSLTSVDKYVWTDSLTTVPGPTGLPDDVIESGTTETRYTYQMVNFGFGDPIRKQEDPITPERIWKLNPLFAETPDDLKEVRFLPNEGLLAEQEVSVVQEFVTSRDIFTSIERIIGSKGNDNIVGNAEDTFFYGGAGADTIDGGDGIDTAGYQHSPAGVTVDLTNLVFKGGDAEGDSLKNIENIIGSAFNDTLVGNASDNRLTPGAGNDFVAGGAGIDTVVFEFASTGLYYQLFEGKLRVILADGPTILSMDTIADDVEFLEFTDKTLSFADALKLVIRGTNDNNVLTGTIIPDYIEGLGGDDIITGLDSDDILDGGDGNDLLIGGGGNDRLIGGTGLDQFAGGTGDDTYVVDNSNEIIMEELNEGFDTVETSVDFTLPANVEAALVVEGKSVTVTGNSLNNVLRGGIGSQTLIGLAGDDILDGGEGADIMIGGAGDDIYFVDNVGDVVGPETADGGTDTIITRISMKVPDNIEVLVVDGDASITLTGDYRNNRFFDGSNSILNASDPLQGMGSSTFDGGAGQDSLALSYAFADSTFALDAAGFLNISNGNQTDKARSIESFVFTDKTVTYDELFETLFPKQDVQLFAGNRFNTKHPIDMSPEGGGKQFLLKSFRSLGENDGNRYSFNTEFQTNGKAFFEGTGLLKQETGTVSRLTVDFSGGNTTQMSVDGFSKPLLTMIGADWLFYQNAIFGGNDRITGSYHSDKLFGYRGDDIIFGGLGDKENYNVEGRAPSPRPSTIRDPGKTATNPAFFVFDGDDYIDGGEGNDILDGGTGDDILIGGPGDDILYGGTGNDRLDGGEGNDTLTGGQGADVIVIGLGMGHDIMTDWEVGVDSLDHSSLGADGASLLTYSIVGPSTVITLTDASTLTLQNVRLPGVATNVVDLSLNTFNGKAFDIGSLGNHVALSGVGDINKDGVGDFAIGNASMASSGSLPGIFTPNTTVYLGDPALPGSVSFKLLSKQNDTGLAISAAGDFNNDGIDDLIIGGDNQSYILFGKTTAFDPIINLDNLDGKDGFQINVSGGRLQTYVAGGFDFNGDGIDDVVIGAPQDNNFGGAAYVVFGSAGPFNAQLDVASLNGSNGMRINGFGSFTLTGESVSNAGDVNGDGIDDLIIGAPYLEVSDPAGIGSSDLIGGAFVVYGSKAPLPAALDLMSMSATQGSKITGVYASGQERTGGVVAGGGDVNGDGYDDVIIGVMRPTSPTIPDQPARAYLVYGSAGGLGEVVRLEDLNGNNGTAFKLDFPGPNHFALGAGSVAIVDDLNNDRLADVVIGTRTTTVFSPEGNPTEVNNGKVFVVYGSKQALAAIVNLDNLSPHEGFIVISPDGSGFGGEVASAGDINGDGVADLLLGGTDAPSMVLFGSPREDTPLSGIALVSGPAIVGKTLSIDTSALINMDALGTLSYQWLNKGSPITNATAAIYVPKSDDVGSEISARLTLTDSQGKVSAITSNTSVPVQIDYASVAPIIVNSAPILNSAIPDQSTIHASAFEYVLPTNLITDPDADDVLMFSASANNGMTLPTWLTFNTIERKFTGTPGLADEGVLTVRVTATDKAGLSVSEEFNLSVLKNPDEILTGTEGNDVFTGGTGNDRIDGKAGIDVAKYQGGNSHFQITRNGTELTVKDLLGTEGTDTLISVERLVFGDKALAFDIDGNAGLVAKLLISLLGKDNWQIPEYVSIGLDLLDSASLSYEQLMKMALDAVLGPNPSNETVVTVLYTNVVGVAPPQSDLALFSGLIADGTYTQTSLAVEASLHPINQDYIQLIGLADKGVEFVFG